MGGMSEHQNLPASAQNMREQGEDAPEICQSCGDRPPRSDTRSEDAASPTSTITYDLEPFETYQHKVELLVNTTWPDSVPETLVIERLPGGAWNRITGITFETSIGKVQKFILRTPRLVERPLSDDSGPLKFVKQFSNISVPEVVAFAHETDNPLGEAYMIQEWIEGKQMMLVWEDLNRSQREKVAAQMGASINAMTSIQADTVGMVTVDENSQGSMLQFNIKPLDDTAVTSLTPYQPLTKTKLGDSVYQEILSMFNFRVGAAIQEKDIFHEEYYNKLARMAIELNDHGHFQDMPITFCYLDCDPRNILIDPDSERGISAFVDWDNAMFAPAVVACEPPVHLWMDWRYIAANYETDNLHDEEPATPDMQTIKQIFEDAAGPVYMKWSHGNINKMLRRIVLLALLGMDSDEEVRWADSMLERWEEIKGTNLSEVAAAPDAES